MPYNATGVPLAPCLGEHDESPVGQLDHRLEAEDDVPRTVDVQDHVVASVPERVSAQPPGANRRKRGVDAGIPRGRVHQRIRGRVRRRVCHRVFGDAEGVITETPATDERHRNHQRGRSETRAHGASIARRPITDRRAFAPGLALVRELLRDRLACDTPIHRPVRDARRAPSTGNLPMRTAPRIGKLTSTSVRASPTGSSPKRMTAPDFAGGTRLSRIRR